MPKIYPLPVPDELRPLIQALALDSDGNIQVHYREPRTLRGLYIDELWAVLETAPMRSIRIRTTEPPTVTCE